MVELLYTGADEQDSAQIEPNKSLGGFVSSSHVANDFFSNLFGEVTKKVINSSPNYICVALSTDVDIENITFTIKTTKHNQGRFRIAAAVVNKNNCDEFVLPQIQNIYSKPVNLSFFDCTSFYGESGIEFSVQLTEGELVEFHSGGNLIGELTYDSTLENTFVYPAYQDLFDFEVRWDVENKVRKLFLIQKDLSNFDPAIEVIRASDSQEIGVIENQLPAINQAALGAITSEQILAIYLERSISPETIRANTISKNGKINCEQHFEFYKAEFEPNTIEKVELEINYDEVIP